METDFKPVPKISLMISFVAAGLFWVHAAMSETGFLLLDYINLPFHEFGHPFFSFFGETMGIWGGTIAQLVIPLIVLVSFYMKRETMGVSFGVFWFGENLLNIAVYIGDAQRMDLPLVGGGEHDWNMILSGLGMLQHTASIARAVKVAGWIIMIGAVVWLGLIAVVANTGRDQGTKNPISLN
jgi:hypothetical protein